MAVVACLGIVVLFTVPHFIHARTGHPAGYSPCIWNLRMLEGAKEQWALEHHRAAGEPVVESEVVAYIKGGVLRGCPQGGKYTFGKVGEHPTCSYPTHTNLLSN